MKHALMTVRDVARLLRVSEVTVRRRIRAGHLKPHRNGRLLRISPAEVRRFLGRGAERHWGLSSASFARDWDNPFDAIYDDWKHAYRLRPR